MDRLGGWAAGRQISPGTLNGIALLLALCAAIWFSSGSGGRGPGLTALAGSVLAMAAAGPLASYVSRADVRPGAQARGRVSAEDSTDWLALPDVFAVGGEPGRTAQLAGPRSAERDRGGSDGSARRIAKDGGRERRHPMLTPDDDDDVIVVVSRGAEGLEPRAVSADHGVPAVQPGTAGDPPRAPRTNPVPGVPWNRARAGDATTEDAVWAAGPGGHWVDARSGRRSGPVPSVPGAAAAPEAAPWPQTSAGAAASGTAVGGAAASGTAASGTAASGTAAGAMVSGGSATAETTAGTATAGTATATDGGARRFALATHADPARVGEQADSAGGRDYGWLAAVTAVAAESAIYGGLAAADVPGGSGAMWPLAVLTIVAAGSADLLGACRLAGPAAARARNTGLVSSAGTVAERLPALPRTVRLAGAGVALAIAGPKAALLTVLGAEVLALAWTFLTLGRIAPASPTRAGAGASRARRRPPGNRQGGAALLSAMSGGEAPAGPASRTSTRTRLTAIVGVDSPEGTTAIRIVTSAQPTVSRSGGDGGATGQHPVGGEQAGVSGQAGGSGEPIPVGGLAQSARPAVQRPAPDEDQVPAGDAGPAGLLALRNDGAAARWAGRLVQGNLIPLPPALAGLVATAMLAALGLRDLRGFIAMTPPIVMMLAAPGSSHPHDGRFDWLVPTLLGLAQYVYLGALGFAVGVPGPVVFAACAMTALWYASLAAGGAEERGTTAGAGWEVRLFLTGVAVTFGLGAFGYVGLAAYLGVLLGRQAATRYLNRMEEDPQ